MLPLLQACEVKDALFEFIQTSYRFKEPDVRKAFFEKDKIKFQTMLYFAAWADAKKYANAEDFLAFRSEPEASTDGTGFYMSKAPSQALWANTRVAVHNNAVKFGIKLVPVAEDLDKDTWNHFWRLYNLLNLSPEMDSFYPGENESL